MKEIKKDYFGFEAHEIFHYELRKSIFFFHFYSNFILK